MWRAPLCSMVGRAVRGVRKVSGLRHLLDSKDGHCVPVRLRLLMRLEELDYHLPPGQIAQRPLDRRDASRLLLLNPSCGALEDRRFAEFPDFLDGNELLVLNNARVIPARLFGRQAGLPSPKPSRSPRPEALTGQAGDLFPAQVGA